MPPPRRRAGVLRPAALLHLVHRLAPWLYQAFLTIRRAIGTGREQAVTEEIYRTMTPVNFSTGLLERVTPHDPLRVSVLPVRGVQWSDWGSEQRLVAGLQQAGAVELAGRRRPERTLTAGPIGISAENAI